MKIEKTIARIENSKENIAIISEVVIIYTVLFIISANELRIGDSGGLESLNFQFCTKLSNSLLLFSKFMKKGNIKGCCDKKGETFNFSLKPPFRQYDVSGSIIP